MKSTSTIFIILFFFAGISVFSFLLNGLLLKFSKTLGIRNHHETIIRWSATSKPAMGGISFFICFLIAIAGYAIFYSDGQPLYQNRQLLGILAASGIAFLMGLSDDAYNTKPLFKLTTQIICSVILIFAGIHISLFEHDYLWLNYLLTVLWVVGMMNSINMLDNMDAIATIVSGFVIFSAIAVFFLNGFFSPLYLLMLIGVLASLTGFLFYNRHPSKIFMGDTGSQFLGLFLSAISILFFWNDTGSASNTVGFESQTKQIIIVLLVFIIPIIDTSTVTINRILHKQSPFIGGKDHTTHALSYLGFSDSRIALIYAGISFLSLLLVFIICKWIHLWSYMYLILFALYFFLVFSVLFTITRIKVKEIVKKDSECANCQ